MDMVTPTAARHIDPDEEAAFLDAIDRWIEREVRPVVMKHDHGDIWPAELVAQMAEMGLFGATIGQEYDGLGLPAKTYAKIVARIASYWMAITGIFNSHLIMALAVERFGTEAQKQLWLPKFASGEIRGGLALTEPNAGTDLQAIRTVARRDGDDYVITGTKTWISNAINGSCFALLVKTDPAASPRYKGMSLFIAPKGPGFTTGKKFDKMGYKAIDSAELIFDDYRLSADHLIGEVEGQGFFQATGGLELGRINVAARGVGLAEGSLRLPPNMRKRARRWASRSPSTRRSSSNWAKWSPAPAPRGCSPSTLPKPMTAASAATWKRGWPNISRPKPQCATARKQCASTAATATPRNMRSSAITATHC